jgi:hypothetical protein
MGARVLSGAMDEVGLFGRGGKLKLPYSSSLGGVIMIALCISDDVFECSIVWRMMGAVLGEAAHVNCGEGRI